MRARIEWRANPKDNHRLARIAINSLSGRYTTCENRGTPGGLCARIFSISPGVIAASMGVKEAETNPHAAATVKATSIGRWGSPLDIANAADFLVSDLSGFIKGCDLRVDGGVAPRTWSQNVARWASYQSGSMGGLTVALMAWSQARSHVLNRRL